MHLQILFACQLQKTPGKGIPRTGGQRLGVLWGQWFLRRDSRLPPFRARGWRDSWRLHICRFRNDRYTEIRLPSLTLPGNRRRPRTYQNIGLYVQLSSPSSCSARKKPRTSSSTLPAGCGREIVCGWELLCSSVWRIVFRSSRNCFRCACWHSARQSQFVRCPAGIADRSSHACRWSGLSRNSVVPKRAVCGLSCMACYLRCQPLVCLCIQFVII